MSIHFQQTTRSHTAEDRTLHNHRWEPQFQLIIYSHVMAWLYTGFGLNTGLNSTLTVVTINNYDSLTELHIPNITVTTAHIKSPQSSLDVAWLRLPTADVPLPLGSWTLPGLSYQLHTSHNCNSQLTQQLKTKSKFYEHYNRRSVCQSILVSCPQSGAQNQTVVGLLMWGALSNQRICLPFTTAVDPRQRRHTRVRVLRDSMTIFYHLRFETHPTWRARSLYL
jgi:hypothetical protein